MERLQSKNTARRFVSLLQLDVNLVEGEPYNCLTQKIKTTESSAIIFKYLKSGKTRFRKPTKTNGVSV